MGWPGDRDVCALNVTLKTISGRLTCTCLVPKVPPTPDFISIKPTSLRDKTWGVQPNLIVQSRCGGACYYGNWDDGIFSTGGGVCGCGSSHHRQLHVWLQWNYICIVSQSAIQAAPFGNSDCNNLKTSTQSLIPGTSNVSCFVSHSGQTGSGKTFTMIGMELWTS